MHGRWIAPALAFFGIMLLVDLLQRIQLLDAARVAEARSVGGDIEGRLRGILGSEMLVHVLTPRVGTVHEKDRHTDARAVAQNSIFVESTGIELPQFAITIGQCPVYLLISIFIERIGSEF
jgi:hypothetical protein